MKQVKRIRKSKAKARLHERNKHIGRYDLEALVKSSAELAKYLIENKKGEQSVDFANSNAVKELNKALLLHFYDVDYWDIPEGYLCPPIPGRADYIHIVADLLAKSNGGEIPTGETIKCLDIGTGANFVYPIIGASEYGWSFIATESSKDSFDWANSILEKNKKLNVKLRLQEDSSKIFKGVFKKSEKIAVSICNPPFHISKHKAEVANLRKLSNLKGEKVEEVTLNFGGKHNELWCDGGEKKFIETMINESVEYASNCQWFTTIVSNKDHLKKFDKVLESVNAKEVKVIPMGQGNKNSRILAWRFES